MKDVQDLLQPSLSVEDGAVPIYSLQATFLTAFFGGMPGLLAIATINSYRLRRLGRDLPLYLVGAVLAVIITWFLVVGGGQEWLEARTGERSTHLALRLVSLGFFGLIYLLHQRVWRNMSLLGVESPNGTLVAIGCIIAGAAAQFGLAWLMTEPVVTEQL